MKLSILIPAHNEESSVCGTVEAVIKALDTAGIDYEILIVNDHSSDGTEAVLQKLSEQYPQVLYFNNPNARGFGLAVTAGLERYTGDAVVIVMADGSDDPNDILRYYEKLKEGYECVFGSRFIDGAKVSGYPLHKLMLNRLANVFIKVLFLFSYNDTTNAFKGYRREVIDGLKPLLSHHFNLTVELPLKAIVRGYRYAVVPISWTSRKTGLAKFRINEMGSRYLFIIFHVFLEKLLSKRDYYRKG